MKSQSRGVQSVKVGGRLLDALVSSSRPMILRDLAAHAKIRPSEAHVYLTSFRKLGLVEQDSSTGKYLLGPFAMRLGMARLRSDLPLKMGSEATADLCAKLGVTVAMVVWGCGAPTVIQIQEGPEEININLREGRIFGVTNTVTGKVFAAFGDSGAIRNRVAEEIADRHWRNAGERRAFLAEFEVSVAAARKQGYAQAVGFPLPGVTAISAPVLARGKDLLFALTLVGREATLDTNPAGRPVRTLLAAARSISESLELAQHETPEDGRGNNAARRAGAT